MDVQSLLNRISFLEEEVHRCYAEIEEQKVEIEAYENALNEFKKLFEGIKGASMIEIIYFKKNTKKWVNSREAEL